MRLLFSKRSTFSTIIAFFLVQFIEEYIFQLNIQVKDSIPFFCGIWCALFFQNGSPVYFFIFFFFWQINLLNSDMCTLHINKHVTYTLFLNIFCYLNSFIFIVSESYILLCKIYSKISK